MNDVHKHLQPAKEEDAPDGYVLCNVCNGEKLVGKDGEACSCARYGEYPGYMKRLVTTTWVCIICGEATIQLEHDSRLNIWKEGPPEPWVNRLLLYSPGTEHENEDWGGVCGKCKLLSDDEAYAKVVYKSWKFPDTINPVTQVEMLDAMNIQEIKHLREENKRLKEALEVFRTFCTCKHPATKKRPPRNNS